MKIIKISQKKWKDIFSHLDLNIFVKKEKKSDIESAEFGRFCVEKWKMEGKGSMIHFFVRLVTQKKKTQKHSIPNNFNGIDREGEWTKVRKRRDILPNVSITLIFIKDDNHIKVKSGDVIFAQTRMYAHRTFRNTNWHMIWMLIIWWRSNHIWYGYMTKKCTLNWCIVDIRQHKKYDER